MKVSLRGVRKKPPPEVFYKKGVLKDFAIIHKKTPVLESLF